MKKYRVEIELITRQSGGPREVCMVVDEETARNITRVYKEEDENQEIALIGTGDDENRVEVCRREDVLSLNIEPNVED